MSYTVTIDKIEQFHDQSSNSEQMDVHVSVKEGTKTKATKRFTFPLGTPAKEIEIVAEKFGSTYDAEVTSYVRQEEAEKARKHTLDVSEKLTGKTIAVNNDKGVTKKKK